MTGNEPLPPPGMMDLHWSSRSPFVRKVMVAAHESGLAGRIRTVPTLVALTLLNRDILRRNPLGKIPTLVLPDGSTLFDSHLICEYFDTLHQGPRLVPPEGPARIAALRWHALGTGLCDLMVLWLTERRRPAPSAVIEEGFALKRAATLDLLDAEAGAFAAAPFGLGQIAIGCARGYLDFRWAADPWRPGRTALDAWQAGFSARPSALATAHVDA